MDRNTQLKTAESVTPMHPDKLCDRISDSILDECLKQDPDARVAIETMGGHGIITVTGELTTTAFVDVHSVVRNVVGDKYGVQVNIVQQSPQIASGVDTGGAGDQGIMVGYACRGNDALIPNEVFYSRSLAQFLFETWPYNGKTQVTMNGDEDIVTIVASFQNVSGKDLKEAVLGWIDLTMPPCVPEVQIFANPAGDWSIGGFEADTGLTGRKLAVDCYGPQVPIGGGAFSGKDATKVDRSAAYMARSMAVYYLKHTGGQECIVKLAYAIGVAQPVMVRVEVDRMPIQINEGWDLTPKGIIEKLGLKRPHFADTAKWGHFGLGFDWDR